MLRRRECHLLSINFVNNYECVILECPKQFDPGGNVDILMVNIQFKIRTDFMQFIKYRVEPLRFPFFTKGICLLMA